MVKENLDKIMGLIAAGTLGSVGIYLIGGAILDPFITSKRKKNLKSKFKKGNPVLIKGTYYIIPKTPSTYYKSESEIIGNITSFDNNGVFVSVKKYNPKKDRPYAKEMKFCFNFPSYVFGGIKSIRHFDNKNSEHLELERKFKEI